MQPDAETIRRVPSWEWLRMHVDPARSRALVTAARVADSLERTVGLPGDEVERRLHQPARHRRLDRPPRCASAPTVTRTRSRSATTTSPRTSAGPSPGAPFDDAEMAEFLEPWRPHRGRVPVLVALVAGRSARRGPRMAPRTHLPARVTRR